ncbi:MAG: hypothetical protein ACI3XG_06090 [Faecousia sp.]
MKKIISLLLVLTLVLSMAACASTGNDSPSPTAPAAQNGGESTPEDSNTDVTMEHHKIAVAFTQINTTSISQQAYLNMIADAFNVEFMFSEAVEDADALMTFMENAYAAGCEAIMNFSNTSIEQANAKANSLGMYIVTNTSIPVEESSMPYCLGYVAGSVPAVADAYRDMVEQFTADGQPHNVIIISAGAGLGNEQHYQTTYAMLETLRDKYNLTFSESLEDLASSRSLVEVDTGTDMKILLYPGYPNSDTYVSGLSSEIQTGDYDIVLGCNVATAKFSVAIDEVERSYGIDIKVGYFDSISDTTTAAFTTIDSQGSPSLNSVIINPGNVLVGTMFAILYNGISGHADAVRAVVDGTEAGILYDSPLWIAPDADTYLAMANNLNKDINTLELSVEDIQQMLYIYNPDVTPESIQAQLDATTADAVLTARGLK